jgi:hypothetical protein
MEYVMDFLENAIDSIDHGLEHYKKFIETEKVSDAKQAIMNLIHGADLLIYAAIVEYEGEEFVYENNSENTISIQDAFKKVVQIIKRKENDDFYELYDISPNITSEEQESYNLIKKMRRGAVHSKFIFNKTVFTHKIEFLIHYIYKFSSIVLCTDLLEHLPHHKEIIEECLSGKEWWEKVESQRLMEKYELLYFHYVKDGGINPLLRFCCSNCNEQMVSGTEELTTIGVCINCGYKHRNLDNCLRCDELYPDYELNGGFCEECRYYFDEYYD